MSTAVSCAPNKIGKEETIIDVSFTKKSEKIVGRKSKIFLLNRVVSHSRLVETVHQNTYNTISSYEIYYIRSCKLMFYEYKVPYQ